MLSRIFRSAEIRTLAARTPTEKVRKHIRRYDLAVAQCGFREWGRLMRLRRERAQWRAVAAQQLSMEG